MQVRGDDCGCGVTSHRDETCGSLGVTRPKLNVDAVMRRTRYRDAVSGRKDVLYTAAIEWSGEQTVSHLVNSNPDKSVWQGRGGFDPFSLYTRCLLRRECE
jgi:hypothetical protein